MTTPEQFLARIHNRLPDGPAHPGSFPEETAADIETLIEGFSRELEALSGHVYRPAGSGEAISIITDILRELNTDRIMAWDLAEVGLPGLEVALRENITIEREPAQLDEVLVGLTGADGGIAQTGAIALFSGAGRSRLASLLPPVHIALLPVDRIYPTLPDFLAAHSITRSNNLVFIAGPSRSGDIEMTLSIGVHGPGETHVILLPE